MRCGLGGCWRGCFRDDGSARWYFARYGLPVSDHINAFPVDRDFRRLFLIGQPFAIDPMFATEAAVNQSAAEYNVFPFMPEVLALPAFRATIPFETRLIRLRLDMFEHVSLRMEIPAAPFLLL